MVYSKVIVKIVFSGTGKILFKSYALAVNFWIEKAISRDVNKLKNTELMDC